MNDPRATSRPDDAKIDDEFDRFERVAEPLPDGSGWFDPAFGPEMPTGVSGESWRAFERDCGCLGRSKSVSTPRNPEQLEDQQCLIRSWCKRQS